MRVTLSNTLTKLAKINKNVYFLSADINPGQSIEKFKIEFPERYIDCGISEQSMIGLAAGLASQGKTVFTYTIATFSLFRPFEMVRDDLCYQNMPVNIIGQGAGTSYSILGGTHSAQEDISIARSLPNMVVFSPCDPYELEKIINYCVNISKKPTYIRIGKTGEKNYKFQETEIWKFGKLRKISKGKDLCIICHGPIIKFAIQVREYFKNTFSISIYSSHTLKPFDKKGIEKIFKKFKNILILEDHSEIGGLQTIVKENAFEKKYSGKIIFKSLKDKFIHNYGKQEDLLNSHDISVKKIISLIKKIK